MITCFFKQKKCRKRPNPIIITAFSYPHFWSPKKSGIPGSFRTIKRPQFHGTIIGSRRHGWWTRCDETSKVDHFSVDDRSAIYTAILFAWGLTRFAGGAGKTQVIWLGGGGPVLESNQHRNIMKLHFSMICLELEVHTSCNWRETPTKPLRN